MFMENVRKSNIELLRLISMLMIVVFHFNGHAIEQTPLFVGDGISISSCLWNLTHTLTITATSIFVLISGFCGINFKVRGVLKLYLRCLVWGMVGFVLYCICKEEPMGRRLFGRFFAFTHNDWWFIITYLELYFLSPVLNAAISFFKKRNLLISIIVFSFVTLYMGYCRRTGEDTWGTSLSHFVFLYLIGRYIRLYVNEVFVRSNRWKWFCMFCFTTIITLFLVVLNERINGLPPCLQPYPYCSPWVLCGAVCLLLFAISFSFQNRCVNYLASSSLSAYLFQDCVYWGFGVLYPAVSSFLMLFSLQARYLILIPLSVVFLLLTIIFDKIFSFAIYSPCMKTYDMVYPKMKSWIEKRVNRITY